MVTVSLLLFGLLDSEQIVAAFANVRIITLLTVMLARLLSGATAAIQRRVGRGHYHWFKVLEGA